MAKPPKTPEMDAPAIEAPEIEIGANQSTDRLLGFLFGPGLMMLILAALGLHLWINGQSPQPRFSEARFYYSAEN